MECNGAKLGSGSNPQLVSCAQAVHQDLRQWPEFYACHAPIYPHIRKVIWSPIHSLNCPFAHLSTDLPN